jgi:hypothetical protein
VGRNNFLSDLFLNKTLETLNKLKVSVVLCPE